MRLLPFPQANEENIPRPFNYRDGDSYCHLSFEDGAGLLMGFGPSAIFIIKEGGECHGAIHAVYTPRGVIVARLIFKPDKRVDLHSFNLGFPSEEYARGELDIIGTVEEVWPLGWDGPRMVLNPVERARESLTRPVIAAST